MTNYRKLIAWQKARELVRDVYQVTRLFPKDELFCLVPQLRRAAISIASNIAESQSRTSKRERNHFLKIALGSSYEVETQLILAYDLRYLTKAPAKELVSKTTEINRLLQALSSKL